MSNVPLPSDHEKRRRFSLDTEQSLSVYSPAGSGKTYAIVQRILSLLKRENAESVLKKLCVVTYTERAANEMRIRARAAAIEAGFSRQCLKALNSAFFGTIHALCASLIRQYGYYLGIPARLEITENLPSLWRSFLTTHEAEQAIRVAQDTLSETSRDLSVFTILEKASAGRLVRPVGVGKRPVPDFSELLAYAPKRSQSMDKIEKGKQVIRDWMRRCGSDEGGMVSIPKWDGHTKEFIRLWEESFRPLKVWIAQKASSAVYHIGLAFQNYRVLQGSITFDDQICLAASLVKHPEACERIGKNEFVIILDEAQDTDPLQFEILLTLAGGNSDILPGAGRFTMVGDPQQSIYGERADVVRYNELHGKFVQQGNHILFDVTFRCSQEVINFANRTFPSILNGVEGQTNYVPLTGRADVGEGCVGVLKPDIREVFSGRSEIPKAHAEAKWLAQWLYSMGFRRLGARSWEEVAILCPRNRWLKIIERALRNIGLQAQVHSIRDVYADHAPYAWFTALVTILSDPGNSFETIGVLREIFGISDEDLALHGEGDPQKFRLDAEEKSGAVADALRQLSKLRTEIKNMPLRRAADVIWECLQLSDRLLSLPDISEDEVERARQHLLSETSAAESSGKLLPEFARHLQRLLADNVQTVPPHSDAIQLLSGKKAKGGEWDAVIVPFLWRKIHTVKETSSLSTDLIEDVDKETRRRRERQELIRLLYVTMTRPRNTLLLIDDRDLFLSPRPDAQLVSFGELMGEDALDGVAPWVESGDDLLMAARSDVLEKREEDVIFPSLNAATLAAAQSASRRIMRRTLPHALADHHVPEDPELRMDEEIIPFSSEGAAYGIWWHEMMHWMPWSKGRKAWEKEFERVRFLSPFVDRAEMEWSKFLVSPLADLLDDEKALIHTEIPFLRAETPEKCLEGIMDMAVWNSHRKGWTLVDWKTNRESDESALVFRYGAQIEAYRASLAAATDQQVTSGIYSTFLGMWLQF